MAEQRDGTLKITIDTHANSLALNNTASSIVVAGRSFLKVYSIDNFTELVQMQNNSKIQNLSCSSVDVDWNHLETHLVATGATNGAVSLWDLKKMGKQKQVLCYTEHERTTHTVNFHPTEAHFLLSGSQDGKIKLFDIRMDKSVSTFLSTESVRNLKISPHNHNTFASVTENGTVLIYDLRKADKFLNQFTAHSGPIYTCDWHPTNQLCLATGGRDKMIKIWNLNSTKPSVEHSIHTIAVVGRVKWRPERKYHISSCALLVDYSIYIWDIRRPYIPYAIFNEHTNVSTDISFQGSNPHTLLSTSKDSTVCRHSSKDAQHPAFNSNCQGATINFRGDLMFVCKSKNKQPVTPIPVSNSANKLNFLNSKKASIDAVDATIPADQFHLAKSTLHNYYTLISQNQNPTNSAPKQTGDTTLRNTLMKDYDFFLGCAKEYKLSGIGFYDLCDHNAEVAKRYGRSNVYMLWNYVKNIYLTSPHINHEIISKSASLNFSNNIRLSAQNSNQSSGGQSFAGGFGGAVLAGKSTEKEKDEKVSLKESHVNSSSMDDLHEALENNEEETTNLTNKLIIDSTELTSENIDCVKSFRNGFLYTGPHDLMRELTINTCSSSLMGHELQSNHYKQSHLIRETETSPPPENPPKILMVSEIPEIPLWQPYQVLADSLNLQSEIGDVQTAACILICMGERRDQLPIHKLVHENWLQSYIELLHRHQLWNEATEIINLSWIPTVAEMNQQSTTIHTNCGGCGKTLYENGYYCKQCRFEPSKCSVCHITCKGIFAWCQGCCHGGHISHIREWFLNNSKCPSCDHLCEY